MKARQILLWSILIAHTGALGLLAMFAMGDGKIVDQAIFWALQIRGWPLDGHPWDSLVALGRGFVSWWFFAVGVTFLLSWVVSSIDALLDKLDRFWIRALWVLGIWMTLPIAVPAYCIVKLVRLRGIARSTGGLRWPYDSRGVP